MTAVDIVLLDADALLAHMFAKSARSLWTAVRAGELDIDIDDLDAFLAAERARFDAWWQTERPRLRAQLVEALRAPWPETDDVQPVADTPIATVH